MRSVPLVLQTEPGDCALAALATIAAAHGNAIGVAGIRRRYGHLDRGPTLDSILAMAAALKLDARALRAGVGELRRLRLPAILHWNFDHFVVLTRVARRHVCLCDPAHGRRRVSIAELRQAYTGVAVEFRKMPAFRSERQRQGPTLRGLLRSFPGIGPYAALLVTLLAAVELLGLAVPVASQVLIDELVAGYDEGFVAGMLIALACVLLLMLLLDAVRQRIGLTVGIDLGNATAAELIRYLLRLPAADLERRGTADLISRIDSLQPLQRALTESAVAACVRGMTLCMCLTVMAFYSPLLTLIAVGAFLLIVLLQAALLPRSRARSMDALIAAAAARQSLLESLRAIATVENFALSDRRLAHWRAAFVASNNARAEQGRLGIHAAVGQGLIGIADQLLFLGIGLQAVAAAELTLGSLFALFALRGRMGSALSSLILAGRELYLAGAHLQRVSELLEATPRPAVPAASCREPLRGALRCRGLRFRYPGGAPLLAGLDVDVAAGEWLVISGPSGCGKSTLLRLLALELPADGGSLEFDRVERTLWDPDALRGQFGIVRQNDRLFAGSIADNLSGFAAEPDLRRLRKVARLAAVWRDLEALPMRLSTPLGEGGRGLSGGQLQRLLIARALYRAPRILFLDEATSHLDARLERRVLANLRDLEITVISVAHGKQACRFGDRVLTLRPALGNCRAALS